MDPARRATLWLLLMCVVWGSSFFTMQLGLWGMAPVVGAAEAPAAFLFFRFLAATLVFAAVAVRAVRGLTRGAVGAGVLLSIPFYAGFLLQVTGLGSTTSTVSAFRTSLTVVLTPLFGRLFFRESVSAGNLAGALVAIGGVWVLTNPAEGGFGRGEVLTAVSAVAFAFQIQLTNAVTRRHSPEGVTFVMFVFATLASGAILAGLGTSPSALVRSLAAPHVAWTVLYTAVACSALAVALMNRFQRDLPPTRAAVLYTLEPVFAALFAAILMDEPMTARKLAGGAIIAGGNLACELLRPRE